jgi:regulator of nucleoside diphosphate kinase
MIISDYDFVRLRGIIDKLRDTPRVDRPVLARLEARLISATVVPPEFVPETVVTMNSRVCFTNLSTGEDLTYTLVFPGEANIEKNKVSVRSPIGMSLIGAASGDVVECFAPAGPARLRVQKVLYQPEAAGYLYV